MFCFTSDIDWAPEWAIGETLNLFEEFGVPLSPFVTHRSELLEARYGAGEDMRRRVGVHPNFLPGSTHGKTENEVIDHVCSLWPDAVSFRSHSYFEHAGIPMEFAKRGFTFDSNLSLFLQSRCEPLKHASGLTRFPVFWTDYAHLLKELGSDFAILEPHLKAPGLKVINVHPMLIALNAPDISYYQSKKFLYEDSQGANWREHRHEGDGIEGLVRRLLAFVAEGNMRTDYLYDVHQDWLKS